MGLHPARQQDLHLPILYHLPVPQQLRRGSRGIANAIASMLRCRTMARNRVKVCNSEVHPPDNRAYPAVPQLPRLWRLLLPPPRIAARVDRIVRKIVVTDIATIHDSRTVVIPAVSDRTMSRHSVQAMLLHHQLTQPMRDAAGEMDHEIRATRVKIDLATRLEPTREVRSVRELVQMKVIHVVDHPIRLAPLVVLLQHNTRMIPDKAEVAAWHRRDPKPTCEEVHHDVKTSGGTRAAERWDVKTMGRQEVWMFGSVDMRILNKDSTRQREEEAEDHSVLSRRSHTFYVNISAA